MKTRQLNKKKLKKFINENGFFYTAKIEVFENAPGEIKKNIPDGATYFEGIVSDGELNRNGYKIRPKALMNSWKDYKNNPVILLGHDPNDPVGQTLNASLINADGSGGVKIAGYIFDDMTDGAFGRGLLKAFSTGTIIEQVEFENIKTGEVKSETEFRALRNEQGWGAWMDDWIMVAIQVDWVESSLVSLPSNKKALLTQKDAIKLYFEDDLNEEGAREVAKNEEGGEEEEKPEEEAPAPEEKPAEEKKDDKVEEPTEQPKAEEGEGTEKAGDTPAASDKPAEKSEGAEEEPKPEPAKAEEKIAISKADRIKLEQVNELLIATLEATVAASEDEEKKEDPKAEGKPATDKAAEGEQPAAKALTGDEEIAEEQAKIEVAPEIKNALQALVDINLALEKELAEAKEKLSKVPNKKGLAIASQFTEPKKEDKKPTAGDAVLALLRDANFAV